MQQRDAQPEIDFSRRTVGSINHHLNEMDSHQNHHGLSSIMVQAPDNASEKHLVLDVMNAFPGPPRVRTVDHP